MVDCICIAARHRSHPRTVKQYINLYTLNGHWVILCGYADWVDYTVSPNLLRVTVPHFWLDIGLAVFEPQQFNPFLAQYEGSLRLIDLVYLICQECTCRPCHLKVVNVCLERRKRLDWCLCPQPNQWLPNMSRAAARLVYRARPIQLGGLTREAIPPRRVPPYWVLVWLLGL